MAPIKHGESKHWQTAEYRAWMGMRARCRNPRRACYARYGGRGITICDRWEVYENFLADMRRKPSPTHSLDRRDNDVGYTPDNCRWATPLEQSQNRRHVTRVSIGGVSLLLREWAERLGVRMPVIWLRIHRGGWDPRVAVLTPPDRRLLAERNRTRGQR